MAERTAIWRIAANFGQARREARQLKEELDGIDKSQHKLNDTNKASNRVDADRQRRVSVLVGATKSLADIQKRAAEGNQRAAAALRVMAAEEQKLFVARTRLQSASLNAQRAEVGLLAARNRLNQVTQNSKSSALELERAHIRVAEAEIRVETSHNRVARAERALVIEQKKVAASSGGIVNNLRNLGKEFDGVGQSARRFVSFLRLLKLPAIITGVLGLASALSALLGGLTAVASALGPVVGLLGALPGLFAAAGQAAGTLFLGFTGVAGALKSYTAAQKSAAKTGSSAAKTEISNARRIRDAQRSLRDAREAQAQAAVSAADDIATAEQRVVEAQQESVDAQQDLNKARDEARKNLRDLQNQLRDLALDEERASLSVEEARANLIRTLNDPGSTDLERRSAELSVREAEQRLKEIKEQATDTGKDLLDAQKKGIEGSDEVVAAKKRESDAQKDVVTAQRELVKTSRESAIAQRNAAEGVQRAIEDLADAQKQSADSAGGASAAANAFAEAMKKLTPEGRAFVKQLLSMQPLLDKLRATAERGLLPGVTDALKRSVSLFPIFNRGVAETSRALGDTAREGGKLVTSGPFKRDFATILKENAGLTRIFGRIVLNLIDAIRNLTIAAIPLVHWLFQIAEGWSKTIKAQAQAGRDSGKTAAFFEKTRLTLTKLGKIFGNLIKGLIGIGKAGFASGQSFLDTFVKVTKQFSDFTNSAKGQNRIKQFFDGIRPALREIGKIIGVISLGFIHLGEDQSTSVFLKQIREQVLPALADLAENLQGEFAAGLVDLLTNLIKILDSLSGAGGGLSSFLTVFNAFLKVVEFIFTKFPPATVAVGGFLAVMGAFRGLKLASQVTGMTAFAKQISKLGEATAGADAKGSTKFIEGLKRMSKGFGVFIKTLGSKVGKVGPLLAKIGTGVGAAVKAVGLNLAKLGPVVLKAFKALRVLLLANPWILIITALIIVVLLVIKYWTQIKTFVLNIVKVIVDFVKKYWAFILPAILGPLGLILVGVIKYWNPIKDFIVGAVKFILNFVKKNWPFLIAFLLGPLALIVLTVIKFWGQIKRAFQVGVSAVLAAFKSVWNTLYGLFISPFVIAFKAVLDRLKGFRTALESAVLGLVVGLARSWTGIKEAFAAPIRFVVNTVIDDWILGATNKVLSFLRLPTIPLVPKVGTSASGGGGGGKPAVARNTGGYIPGTGNQDSVPAILTPGEFVIRKQAAQALGAQRLRQLNRTGFAGFEDGGNVFSNTVNRIGGAAGSVAGVIGSTVKDIAGKAVDLARSGAAGGLDQLFKPIRSLLSHIPDAGSFTQVPKGFANLLMDKAVEFVRGKEEAIFTSTSSTFVPGNAVGRWAPLVGEALRLLRQPTSLVPAVLELIRHESGGNPQAINLTDINAKRGDPSRGLMQTIGSTFRAYAGQFLQRGIFDPLANIFAGLNYGIHRYGSVMNIPGIYSLAHGGSYRPYASGGTVPGSGSRDTVPAMLTPGEFVIRKSAAKRIGMHNLHALNQMQYFHEGGPVRGVVRKQSKGNWVNSLFLNTSGRTSFPGNWDLALDQMLGKAYPKVPGVASDNDIKTLALLLNSSRTRGGAGTAEALNRYKTWSLQHLLSVLSRGRPYIGAKVPLNRRNRIYGEYNSWVNKAHVWNSDLDRVLGLPKDGRFGSDDVAPTKHVLDHAFGKPHDKFAPRPWGPLDAAELADQEQERANALQQEYNGYLSLFASWGLNDLVQKLYEMGPADGMEIARAAAKNRNAATNLNAAYAESARLTNPNVLDALKLVGYISSWPGQPGLRDLARKLEVPDYAILQLFESVKDQVAKAVPAEKLARLVSDIELFRQGLFYANSGGTVPGSGTGDTVPAMLTPGEFVLRKSAVRALGLGNVMALNHFAEGGPVGLGMSAPSIPKLASSLSGIGSHGGTYVEHADQVNNNYTMNTSIYNPVGENSIASMNRNLKRQARLGVLRPGQQAD